MYTFRRSCVFVLTDIFLFLRIFLLFEIIYRILAFQVLTEKQVNFYCDYIGILTVEHIISEYHIQL